ncbi:MAG: hypothetical protein COY04_00335, partial [Parcubacteria group bacterium CG_4_10_14_0_2_um_filter_7_35_8]
MKNFLNLKSLVILSIVLIIGIFLPFHHAEALIQALASNIVFTLIAVVLEMIVTLTSVILLICVTVLNIVTSPNFITLPYTSGGIVDIGWPIVRDLANLGFTLALVFIGLATALQIEEYGFKKALPRLLVMALLINFTPVIAGIIVDASNIIMNFFLTAVGDWHSIVNLTASHYASIGNKLSDFFTRSIGLDLIAEAVVICIFNILAGFFFLLYAFLFITRYVAIWALVIVSPLAFFAYVFPKTQSYYRQWWNQFIQWCFIGVPASFFLYLSWQLLDRIDTLIVLPPASTWAGVIGAGDTISNLLPYGVVLIFLFLGFITSLSSGAIGATAIISTAKGLGNSATKFAGASARKGIERAKRQTVMTEGVGKLTDNLLKSEKKGFAGWAERGLGLQLSKARLNASNQVNSFMNDKTLKGFLAQDDITAALTYAKQFNPLNPDNDIRQIAVAAAIGEEKKDIGLVTARKFKSDPNFIKNAINKASNAGLRDIVKKIVGDAPSAADDDTVIKSYLPTEDTIQDEKNNLGNIQQEFLAIAKKKNLGKDDNALIKRLKVRLGDNWRNRLTTAGNIDNIINNR